MMICMRKLIKNFFWLGALILTVQSAVGFSVPGPVGNAADAWQIALIGYGPNNFDDAAPKDIYEEYRLVVPVLYYACDASFLTYYGAGGQTNIDAAFAIVNGVTCGQTNTPLYLYSPTNGVYVDSSGRSLGTTVTLDGSSTLDRYSADMSEFPVISQQINYTAETLGILDVKSLALHEIVCEIGLENPDRYVWTLHDRLPDPSVNNPRCPEDEQYIVVQRNFDVNPFLNSPYSSYINDALYTFYIAENCGRVPGTPYDAKTFPAPADTSYASAFSAVAAGGLNSFEFGLGGYYTGLTKDDAAGFRYLYSSNNINYEATAPSGSQLFTISTNSLAPQVFPPNGALAAAINAAGYYYYDGTYGYGDLAALYAFARTNNQATLQAAYPGLVINGVGITFALATNETYSSYYAPAPPGSAYGSPPQFVVATNYTPYYQFYYTYTFGNVFTNHYSAQSRVVRQTVSSSAPVGSPYGTTSVTNSVTLNLANRAAGDFFVLPPFYNGVCPMDIVSYPGIVNVLATTNLLTSANTNTVGTNFSSSIYLISYFTNYQYVIYPVTCTQGTAPPALRRGIGRVGFIRANYDSLLGQFFSPLTNDYSMVMITNGQQVTEHYRRVVTQPDYLFSAQDLTVPNPPSLPYGADWAFTTPTFDQSTILNGLAGPGTIVPGATITFNKSEGGALYQNGSLNNYSISTNSYLNQYYQVPFEAWGSFDWTTNDPVIYPNSLSLANLGNQMLLYVTPFSVPDGTVGVAYNGGAGVKFSATGGQPPYVWGMSPQIPGLTFNAATQTLSGTPAAAGVYGFALQVTDAGNRNVSLNYIITIH